MLRRYKNISSHSVLFSAIGFWLALFLTTPNLARATALGDLAASMQPGTWAEITTSNMVPSLANVNGSNGHLLIYTDDMVWNPSTLQAFMIGADHLASQGPQFVSYSASTNTWQRLPRPGWLNVTFFHGYDHSAIDQARGNLYHRPYSDNVVHKYNIASQTWTQLPNPVFPNNYENCCDALEYFPEMNGLVWVRGNPGEVWLFNEATQQWSRLATVTNGNTWQQAEYNPIHKVIAFVVGGRFYKLSTSGQVTQLQAPPVSFYDGSGYVGVFSVDPVSGKYLFLTPTSRQFYTYDITTDTWQAQSSQTKPNLSNQGVVATPIATYGVTFFAACSSSQQCRAYLYKHSTGTGTPSPIPPTVSISANPSSIVSGTASTLTWSSTNANSCTASGGWSGTKASSGSQNVTPTGTTTYSLACTGSGGTATQSATITVTTTPTAPPTVSISANPSSIVSGTASTLTWSSTNANSCTASGGWSGTKASSGSQNVTPTSTTPYSLACTGSGGTATQSATVTVTTTPTAPPATPPAPPPGSIPAFPGAEGFGTETPGGRGGKVYVVTTLNWSGPGSLGQALLATEPRIIVFRVSGVINVPNGVELTAANSYVTVAGQTSPGGITLTGSPGYFIGNYQTNFHDAVFRFIRFRGRGNYDNIQFNDAHHLVFDHVDFSGGTDESFDITHGRDVTIQWSTITNSDSSGQNYGSLIAYNPTANFSLHHNFYAHHVNRCAPHFHWGGGVPTSGATIDFRNNVVYNCAFDAVMWTNDAGSSAEGSRIKFNLIGNYFKAGPNTPSAAYDYRMPAGSQRYESNTIYQGGSLRNVGNLSSPMSVPSVTTQSAAQAFDLVLDRAGAFPRDPMNTRTVAEARNGTGSMGKINDAFLTSAPTPPVDTDLDGMPDSWELARGLNPSNPSDAALDRNGDGYTNIEEYINELANSLIPGAPPPPTPPPSAAAPAAPSNLTLQ